MKRMENDRIAKRVYVGEGGPRKRWIDLIKDYLRKRGIKGKIYFFSFLSFVSLLLQGGSVV